jgi:hypothetical protein
LERVVEVLRRRADGFGVERCCCVICAWYCENDRREEVGDVCRGGVGEVMGGDVVVGVAVRSVSQRERESSTALRLEARR